MTEATEASADLEARIKTAQEGIPALEKALASAEAASKGAYGKVGMGEFMALDATREGAKSAHDAAQADVAKLQKGVDALAAQANYESDLGVYNEGIKPCRVVTNPLVTAQQKAVLAAKETLLKVGITSVITRTTLIDGNVETEAELVGADKPTPPKKGRKPSTSGNGGNGGGRFVNVSPDRSQRLSDREFVALVGPKHIGDDKTAHALSATGGTLYVTARSLQDKAGWTREQK